MIRDALYLVVAVTVLAVVADWLLRRAAADLKAAAPKLPSAQDLVDAPGFIRRGFWDFVKEGASGRRNDARFITQDEARALAKSKLAERRARLSRFGVGLQ